LPHRSSIGIALATTLVLLSATSCARKSAVTVEQVYEGQELCEEDRSLPKLHPPKCGPLPEAEYPELPREHLPERVAVRVDLIIDTEGKATKLRATVLDREGVPRAFVDAALAAARRFDCLPALQMPSPDSDRILPTAVEYASSVVYRFYRDEKSAKASF
jgi:hypothetical protein